MNKNSLKVNLYLLIASTLLSATFFAKAADQPTIQNQSTKSYDDEEYKLGSGDKLRITVFNQEQLSGEYTINGGGLIALPLIGDINAKDLSVKQVEQAIANKLKPDYLLNPKVNVQVLNYRPFYILGEVKNPQSYPYVDGMTYRNAIVIAGGFTYRAKEDHVMVIRMKDPKKQEIRLDIDEKVLPGDIIHIEERYF